MYRALLTDSAHHPRRMRRRDDDRLRPAPASTAVPAESSTDQAPPSTPADEPSAAPTESTAAPSSGGATGASTDASTDAHATGSGSESEPTAENTVARTTAPAAETTIAPSTTMAPTTTVAPTTTAPAAIIQVSFSASTVLDVEVDAELVGFRSSSTKGIASVCLVQYNQYGNEVYRNGDPYSASAGSSVEVDGVRYPRLLIDGCRASDDNFGVYTKVWSVDAERGVNGSLKDWYDIAIRAEDGQVRVFCRDMTQARGSFVERRPSDYAGRTSLGPCPG
jgi:hypothetical protein